MRFPENKMRERPLLFLLPLVLALPPAIHAAEFRAGRSYTLAAGETVSENLYAGAGNVTVSGNVEGDFVSAGGNVLLRGDVSEDVIIAGGDVDLIGSVGGDLRVAGGSVTLSGHVGGDLLAAGGQVRVLPGATVGGEVVVAGGQVAVDGAVDGSLKAAGGEVNINNTVAGSVQVRAGSLTLGESARIGGDLDYWTPGEASIHEDATVGGAVTFHRVSVPDRESFRGVLRGIGIAFTSLTFLMLLVAGVVGFLAFGSKSEEMVKHTLQHFGQQLLTGFVLLIVIPAALMLVAMTVVGLPLAVLGCMLYCSFGIVAGVYAGIVFGSLLFKALLKSADYEMTWKVVLGGITLLFLVSLVPVLGTLIYAVFFLAAFGSLFHLFYQRFWRGGISKRRAAA